MTSIVKGITTSNVSRESSWQLQRSWDRINCRNPSSQLWNWVWSLGVPNHYHTTEELNFVGKRNFGKRREINRQLLNAHAILPINGIGQSQERLLCTEKKTRRNTSTSLGPVQAQLALHGRVAKINCRPVSQNGIYGPFATTQRWIKLSLLDCVLGRAPILPAFDLL